MKLLFFASREELEIVNQEIELTAVDLEDVTLEDISNQTDEWRRHYSQTLVSLLRKKSIKLAFTKVFQDLNYRILRTFIFAIMAVATFGFVIVSGYGLDYRDKFVLTIAILAGLATGCCVLGVISVILSKIWEGSCYGLAGSLKLLKDKFSLWTSDAETVHDYATLVLASQSYQLASDDFGGSDDDMSDEDE